MVVTMKASTETINQYCVKCGSENCSIMFSPAGDTVVLENNNITTATTLFNNAKGKEQLVLTCNTCGYMWIREPLDKETNNQKNVHTKIEKQRENHSVKQRESDERD